MVWSWLAQRLAGRGLERELGHADDAAHRRADLVAHDRQELGLGARRRFRFLLGQEELLVALAAPRHVVRHGVEQTPLGIRLRRPQQRLVAAVGALEAVLERDGGNALRQLGDLALGRLEVVGMHQVVERPRQELLVGPAQDALERGVDLLEAPVGARDAEHVEREIEEGLGVVGGGRGRGDRLARSRGRGAGDPSRPSRHKSWLARFASGERSPLTRLMWA